MAMDELRERVAGERRRLREVRQALTAAVEQGANGEHVFVTFYIAIGDYFDAAMGRLHIQDVRMGDMLRDKADMDDPANQQALAELDERLAGNQLCLKNMLTARDALIESSDAALAEFETAGKAYSDYIIASMGHHPGSTELAQRIFSVEDWAYMAGITENDQAREEQLYTRVFATVPGGLKLPESG
jgi:hypothetical protein